MRVPFSVAMGAAALLLFGAAAAGGEAPAQPDPAPSTVHSESSSVTETTATEEPDYSYLEPNYETGRVATPPEERAGYPAQGPAPAGMEWTLRGPRYSEERCTAESRSWPSSATVCFTLDGDPEGSEGWWFWALRQAL